MTPLDYLRYGISSIQNFKVQLPSYSVKREKEKEIVG